MNYQLEQLTKRELEVLRLIADGLTNKEIIQKLYISKSTLNAHIVNIYSKFGLFETEIGTKRVKAVLIYLKEVNDLIGINRLESAPCDKKSYLKLLLF